MYKGAKVTFVRIPRNASTAVYETIGEANSIRTEKLNSLFSKTKYRLILSPSHCLLKEAVDVLGKEILSLPCFCVSRDPYQRMISCYEYITNPNYDFFLNCSHLSFINFCRLCAKYKNDYIYRLTPQAEYIEGYEVSILKFESLQKDFIKFLKTNNLVSEINLYLPRLNVMRRSHKNYFCKESIDIVNTLFEDDFKRFGYSMVYSLDMLGSL